MVGVNNNAERVYGERGVTKLCWILDPIDRPNRYHDAVDMSFYCVLENYYYEAGA